MKLIQTAAKQGTSHCKLKVGLGLEADCKRVDLVGEMLGDDAVLMAHVRQLWDVDEARYRVHEVSRGFQALVTPKASRHLQPYMVT